MSDLPGSIKGIEAENYLAGGGEMGALIQTLDWSETPVGPPSEWPQSLRTVLSVCLASRFPMMIWWGPEMIQFYNDAYRPILGATKHPRSMGQRGPECWAEIWNVIGPMAESVWETGQATWSDDFLLVMDRNRYIEETYFTFSYSPIRDESGGIGGILVTCTETTTRVLGERRLRTLRDLGAQMGEGNSTEAVARTAANILAQNPLDLPFALLYLLEGEAQDARLAGSAGIEAGTAFSPLLIKLVGSDEETAAWPLQQVAQTDQPLVVEHLPARFERLPAGPWPDPPQAALVLPIAAQAQDNPAGFLVAGLSPHRQFDDDYCSFLQLAAGHIATTIAKARAYEAERQRVEAMIELDRAKITFFSNVSHEFRTPLTLMLGPLEELLGRSDTSLSTEARDQIEVAHRNSLRLLKLVNTLLDFSRIEAGRIQATYEPVDLSNLTMELASVFRSAIEGAGLHYEVRCPPLPELIYVDKEMWEKIILNLIANAFKFTFKGEIAINLYWAEDHVELAVRDTGVGVPQEELPHLFERFHRVRGAQARTYEGSGIGLALVRDLVKLHGGTVRVTSSLGQGSTFTVSIPAGSTHLPADRLGAARPLQSTALNGEAYLAEALRWLPAAPTANVLEPSTEVVADLNPEDAAKLIPPHPAYILLADDNADMREYLTRLLSQHWRIEAVGDGLAALAAVQAEAPDLILADVMMPGLDGLQLLRQLRAEPRTREIPIIFLSARAGEEAQVEGLEAGADDYLIKPFSARELIARIRVHLNMTRLRQEAAHRDQVLRLEAEATRDRLEHVLASIRDSLIILDREWCYLYANHRAAELAGWKQKELLGKDLWETFPELVGTPFYTELHRAMADQKIIHFEQFYVPANRWFEQRAYPSTEGLSLFTTEITERKQAEAALRQANERFEVAEAAARAFLYDYEVETGEVERSAGLERVLGYRESEIPQVRGWWQQQIHPEDREQALREAAAAAAAGADWQNLEYRVRHKEGHYLWVWDRARLIRDGEGRLVRRIGSTVDITARKQIEAEREQALAAERRQVEQLQALATAAIDLSAVNNLNTKLQIITERARTLIGAHQAGTSLILEQNWDQAINTISLSEKYAKYRNDEILPDGSGIYAHVCRTNRPLRLTQAELETHSARRGFGSETDKQPPLQGWLAVPLVGRNGQNMGLIQLSDRYEGEFTEGDEAILIQLAHLAAEQIESAWAEQALRESEERFRNMADYAPVMIWITRPDGYCTYLSRPWYEFTGQTPETGLGFGWLNAVHPDDGARAREMFLKAVEQRESFRLEYRLRRHDGDYCWAIDSAAPRFGQNGEFLGFIGSVIDITERKQAEEDLARSEAALRASETQLRGLNQTLEQRVTERTVELQRSMQELDQFAYVASHDLKAPLRAIEHLANWIAEDAGEVLPLASKNHLAKMQGRIQRMEKLLDDLLAYSRAGRDYYKETDLVDTRILVEEVIDLLTPPQGFTIAIQENMPTLATRRTPLELVFRNLISNAINHHYRPDGQIHISAREAGPFIEFSVADNGPGIDEAFHERIFQMFQTLHPRDQMESSGMGLAVVKKVVESRGGTVKVISGEGQGAIFKFTWPKD